MASFGKKVVRTGVILALVGGTAVVVAGPHRAGALFHQTRHGIQTVIDSQIDDPIALRAQIKQLEAEYPKKIAQVRSDLAEVQGQTFELERELKVAARVVGLASADLERFDGVIAQARSTQEMHPAAIVRVSMSQGQKMDLDDAYMKCSRIDQTRMLYTTRASDLNTELGYLSQQEQQLAELLTKLETERAEFQAKLFQLDAQIDSIARNERLIKQLEDRQETIDNLNRYESHSLDQLSKKLDTIRSEQRGRIEAIAGRDGEVDYEQQAKYLIDQEGVKSEFEEDYTPTRVISPEVIEVGPQDVSTDSVASSN